MYICIYVYMNICMYMYTCIYVYLYINIHIQIPCCINVAGIEMAGDLDLGELARRTEGFSGADITNVCRDAAMMSMRRLTAGLSLQGVMYVCMYMCVHICMCFLHVCISAPLCSNTVLGSRTRCLLRLTGAIGRLGARCWGRLSHRAAGTRTVSRMPSMPRIP